MPPSARSSDAQDERPSTRLRAELEALYDDYLARWGADEENRLFIDIAEAFRPSLRSLTVTPELVARIRALHDEVGTPAELADVPGFVQSLTSHPIVREGVEIRLAYDALATLKGVEARLEDLFLLIGGRRLIPRAERLLGRAAHLYLWGMEPETVIVCGATLESAYQERFKDIEMFRLQIVKEGDWFEPHQYEAAALASGAFSRKQRDLASQIRRARNAAIHEGLVLAFPALSALKGVAELLACLFPDDPGLLAV